MASLIRSSSRMLRCFVSRRSPFVWVLTLLLILGAASYTQGSRYALIGHSSVSESTSPGSHGADETNGSRSVPVIHKTSPRFGPTPMDRECCKSRSAPRGEPAPLRTGGVDPPTFLIGQQAGDEHQSRSVPAEPGPQRHMIVQLSISRT